MLFIKSVNLWLLLEHLISLLFFVLSDMLKVLFFMVYASLLIHPWSYLDTLMQIGQVTQQIVAQQQGIVSS
jgi:hypothetical protein